MPAGSGQMSLMLFVHRQSATEEMSPIFTQFSLNSLFVINPSKFQEQNGHKKTHQ